MLAEKHRHSELRAPPELPAEIDSHGAGSLAHDLAIAARDGSPDVRLLYARCVLGVPACGSPRLGGVSSGVLRRRLVTAADAFLAARS